MPAGRPLYLDYTTERGVKSIAKSKTGSEVKNRWNAKTYKRYTVSLRVDDDADIIRYLEAAKRQDKKIVTQIFREGYNKIKK